MSSDFGGDGSRPDTAIAPDLAGRVLASILVSLVSLVSFVSIAMCAGGTVAPFGLVAPTNHPCCRYTPNAVRRLEHSCSAKAEHRRSEGSLPAGADHRATTLYAAGPEGPDHDAVMRIGGEAPGRRAHSQERCQHHGRLRVTATSDRQRRPAISCSSGSESLSCRRSPVTPLARQRQPAPRP
jgi:hypothetical protein